MDKLIARIWKNLQSVAQDETMWNLVQIYRRHMDAGSFQPEVYRSRWLGHTTNPRVVSTIGKVTFRQAALSASAASFSHGRIFTGGSVKPKVLNRVVLWNEALEAYWDGTGLTGMQRERVVRQRMHGQPTCTMR
jgi:hypothetical protein